MNDIIEYFFGGVVILLIGIIIGLLIYGIYHDLIKRKYTDEIISDRIYDVTKKNSFLEDEIPSGKLMRVVTKRTYESGKIKYITKEIKC